MEQHFAQNFAYSSVGPGQTYANITTCLIAVNNTDNGCSLNVGYENYTINNSYKFYLPIVDAGNAAIRINADNITLDCNRTEIIGETIGYGILLDGFVNSTILNCNLTRFDIGVYINTANNTVINNTYINGSTSNGIFLQYSNNTNMTNIKVTDTINNEGIFITLSNFIFINKLNASNNYGKNLNIESDSTVMWLYNSYFFNSITSDSVDIKSNNSYIINNTIMNSTANDKSGLVLECTTLGGTTCTNITVKNNTIFNNAINFVMAHSNYVTVENNYFGEHTDEDFAGTGVSGGTLFIDCLYCNATIKNNIFNTTKKHQLIIGDFVGPYTEVSFANITNNTFKGTPNGNFDILMVNSGNRNNSIWNNSFYGGQGINDSSGFKNTYCIEGYGNFYVSSVNYSHIGAGDCGPVNLTYPRGGQRFFNPVTSTIKINWSKQSSGKSITYYLFYSADNGTSWTDIASTSSLGYNWDISAVAGSPEYLIRVIPFDGSFNGTTNQSNFAFGIVTNN